MLLIGVGIPLLQSFLTEVPQVLRLRHAFRRSELRQMQLAEGEFHVAAIRDLRRVLQRFRRIGKDFSHLILGLQIELVVGEAHSVFFVDGSGRLDAHEYVLGRSVLPVHVVDVVGGHERNARLLVESFHVRQDPGFFFKSLILQFQEVVARAEDTDHLQGLTFGSLVVAVEQMPLHVACQTGGSGDDALAVPVEDVLVDSRLIVKSVPETFRNDLHEILVSGVVFGQKDQMPHHLVVGCVLVESGPGRRVDFTPDDRLDPRGFAGSVEIDHAEHDPVVRDGQGVHSEFLGAAYESPDPRRSVQETVFSVYV